MMCETREEWLAVRNEMEAKYSIRTYVNEELVIG
jgi:hypothetical protein